MNKPATTRQAREARERLADAQEQNDARAKREQAREHLDRLVQASASERAHREKLERFADARQQR